MNKCKCCYLRDAKPCYECSACMVGDDHFRPAPELPRYDHYKLLGGEKGNDAREWIKCNDHRDLPPLDIDCEVLLENGEQTISHVYRDTIPGFVLWNKRYVTHWRPLQEEKSEYLLSIYERQKRRKKGGA